MTLPRFILPAAVCAALCAATSMRAAEPAEVEPGAPANSGTLDQQLLEGLSDPLDGELPDAEPAAAPSDAGEPPDQPAEANPAETGEDKPSSEPNELDKELLEGLMEGEELDLADDAAGSDIAADEADPLVELSRRMREVETLIAQAQAGDKTQGEQQEIVSELEKLIRQMQQQAQQSRPSSSSQRQQTASRRPVKQPGQPQAGQPANGEGRQPAQDSSDRLRDDPARKPDPRELEAALRKDVWGHLPERLRMQMDQYSMEEFLPKYELEIEEYFKALVDVLNDGR